MQNKSKINLNLDLRILSVVLLLIIAGMLLVWRPWQYNPTANDRTIKVTGEATVKAEPDQYVFNPSYSFKNANKDKAIEQLTAKSNEVIDGLKKLGVEDKNIKTNSDGYDYPVYYEQKKAATYTLRLTITVDSRELSQKIQDYLITTTPEGSVSPNVTFSETKRKELENQARDEATKDARAKADQSAENLGFKVGAVKSVEDGAGFNARPLPYGAEVQLLEDTATSSLPVQPGENELRYSVTVVYFVR